MIVIRKKSEFSLSPLAGTTESFHSIKGTLRERIKGNYEIKVPWQSYKEALVAPVCSGISPGHSLTFRNAEFMSKISELHMRNRNKLNNNRTRAGICIRQVERLPTWAFCAASPSSSHSHYQWMSGRCCHLWRFCRSRSAWHSHLDHRHYLRARKAHRVGD